MNKPDEFKKVIKLWVAGRVNKLNKPKLPNKLRRRRKKKKNPINS